MKERKSHTQATAARAEEARSAEEVAELAAAAPCTENDGDDCGDSGRLWVFISLSRQYVSLYGARTLVIDKGAITCRGGVPGEERDSVGCGGEELEEERRAGMGRTHGAREWSRVLIGMCSAFMGERACIMAVVGGCQCQRSTSLF